jgi:hypothetical protein
MARGCVLRAFEAGSIMFRTLQVSDPHTPDEEDLDRRRIVSGFNVKETLIVVNVSVRRGDESCFRFQDSRKERKTEN